MARRFFRRRPPRWFWAAGAVLALLVIRWSTTARQSLTNIREGEAVVRAVVDARTLKVAQEQDTAVVRLLGLESCQRDEEAKRWLEDHLNGQTVWLDLDKRRRDRDDANFAYVYLGDEFVNARLIELGLAKHSPHPGDSANHAKALRGE